MGKKNAIFLCLAVTALVTLGLVMLTSTSIWVESGDKYSMLKKQAMFIGLGVFSAMVAAVSATLEHWENRTPSPKGAGVPFIGADVQERPGLDRQRRSTTPDRRPHKTVTW